MNPRHLCDTKALENALSMKISCCQTMIFRSWHCMQFCMRKLAGTTGSALLFRGKGYIEHLKTTLNFDSISYPFH